VRIVIAEDSVLLREGLTTLVTNAGLEVVEAVPDAGQLLRAVAEHRPDLAVVDVRMPPTYTDEGIRAALVLRREHPDVAVLVLSQYVEERYATDLLSVQTSGVGYLLKDRVAHVSDFLDALCRVAAGGPRWTRRSSASSWSAAATTRWTGSPRASSRCSSSWPRAAPTAPSSTRCT
jgi:DNA-binding NarL/FixJ family response regulator